MRLSHTLLLTGLLFSQATYAAHLSPDSTVWHPLVLDVAGPATNETDLSPHPFLDYRLNVTFTSPDGDVFNVPGFFAGNGRGHGQGSIWRVRFTPHEPGEWRWSIVFERGENIAVADADDVTAATPVGEHGAFGTVLVADRDPASRGMLAQGRLDYAAGHYLKQADGDYWINGGSNGPENFFGYAGFDNTLDQPGGLAAPQLENGLHLFAPHMDDWRAGDPEFTSNTSGVSSHGIIGAINYLSAQSINSINVQLMNLGADGADTYPFIDTSGTPFANTRYDVSKLHQWNLTLNHMQEKGIAAHIMLAQQSPENTEWLDQGTLGIQRKLFLREILARFSYLNGVRWTLSNGGNVSSTLELHMAEYLRSLDWAVHPIAIQDSADRLNLNFDPSIGYTQFDAASIQSTTDSTEQVIEMWRERSGSTSIPWVINSTPTGTAIALDDSRVEELRTRVLYPIYFSGANLEGLDHLLSTSGDSLQTEDFRRFEPMYRYMHVTRKFLQENVPIDRAAPADTRLSGGIEDDQLFGIADEVFAAWFADGRGDRRISAGGDASAQWQLQWFNSRTGNATGAPVIRVGNQFTTGSAPGDVSDDWMLIMRRLAEPSIAAATEGAQPIPSSPFVTDMGGEENTPAPSAATTSTAEVVDDQGGGAAGFIFALLIVIRVLSKIQLWPTPHQTYPQRRRPDLVSPGC